MQFVEVAYQDPRTRTYLGSPSIVRLDDGSLLATHDYFGPGCARNHAGEEHLTSVYRSDDGGENWRQVTHIANAFWSSLFTLQGAVYLIGVSQHYGSIVIRRSTDGGYTWSHPADRQSGLLFRGGPGRTPPNYHCAPVPVVVKDGHVYRAFEDNTPLGWPAGFQACVISADAGSDLLDGANWKMSNRLRFDRRWLPASWGAYVEGGWLEGNVVDGPEGRLWNVLRLNARTAPDAPWSLWNRAALVSIDEAGSRIAFDPEDGFIRLPGGHTKFTIRRDPVTGSYLTLSNGVHELSRPSNRSALGLYASRDLRSWVHCTTLLKDDSQPTVEAAAERVGFQYVDWQFDGEDIIYLVRTAYGGAHNYHDANRITFHRLRKYVPCVAC
ncbi:MAG: exo-alpha-sialidase [Anaerolineae bacterium]|nr:exo-alpha-sialidase [Anaerolineae bacterium]